MFIVVAILVFGFMILIHELGHYLAARAFKVRVLEFAIGLGPKLISKERGETLYSLRVLPFGGFCKMDEDSVATSPRSFNAQSRWKRIVILSAGGIANLLVAYVIILLLSLNITSYAGNVIDRFVEGNPIQGQDGLAVGDRIVSINSERIFTTGDFRLIITLADGDNVDLVVDRGGDIYRLYDFPLYVRDFIIDGEAQQRVGIYFNLVEPNFGQRTRFAAYTFYNNVRMIRLGLLELFRGGVGADDLAGPIQIVSIISDIGGEAATARSAIVGITGFAALLMVNLAIINLLPLPALDGGRIVMQLLTGAVEAITRKQINPIYEKYVHATGFVLLVGLMLFVVINDILRLAA
jgi:regulator of sigma E protease